MTEADSLFQWKLDFASGTSWVLGTSEVGDRKGWISTIITAFLPQGAKPNRAPDGAGAAAEAAELPAGAAAAAADGAAGDSSSRTPWRQPSFGRVSLERSRGGSGSSSRTSSNDSCSAPPASAPLPALLQGAVHSAPSARRIVLSGGQAVLTTEPVYRGQAPPPTPAPSQRHLDLSGGHSAKTAPLPMLSLPSPAPAKYSWLKALFQYPLQEHSPVAAAGQTASRPDLRPHGSSGAVEEYPSGSHRLPASSRYQPEGLAPATQALELLIERYDPSLVTEALAEQFER